ncbi:MAG: glycosyltransferase family 2 protein [Euryarchaeota archaeon]|nr:glycosyltransferase family 2 protein [Euryarchaeota archaeon]
MKLLSVVIPALNEEEGIGEVLDEIPRKELEGLGYETEVIVVDGESRDRTRDIAKSKAARVIVEPRRGYGRAYLTGFEFAKGDVIATGDADRTYPFNDLPRLVKLLDDEGLDFITTNRLAHLEKGAMSTRNKFGNWMLSACTRVLFLCNIRDSQSGMWVFRRGILGSITLTAEGMPLSEEIKIEAFKNPKLKAKEVPIHYRVRAGQVKLNSLKDGYANMLFLVKKRLGLLRTD